MDISKWKKDELVKYLKERDVGTSGLNKPKLAELVDKSSVLNLSLLEKDDSAACEVKFRTLPDGQVIGIGAKFSSNLRHLPSLQLADIFAYLLTGCQWSSERLRAHRDDDGFQLFRSKHIDNVEMLTVSVLYYKLTT